MATKTITLSNPETSPTQRAYHSPSISWPLSASLSPAQRPSRKPSISWSPLPPKSSGHILPPSIFQLPTPPSETHLQLPLSLPCRSVDSHLLDEHDVLSSTLIPEDHKPTVLDRYRQLRFILTTHDRRGTGFDASGATPADRLVVAEQLARMTMMFDWYTGVFENEKKKPRVVEDGGDECESMATEMLDAGLSASEWQSTWDQPCFVSPLCLMGKEKEVAELAAWGLKHFERPIVPTVDDILDFWKGPEKEAKEPLRGATKPHARDPKAEIEWLDSQRPGKGRFRAHNDIFYTVEMSSPEYEHLDHNVWKQAAEGAGSPKESLEVGWPPEGTLEGYCLMDKLALPENSMDCAQRQWVYNTLKRNFRQALHRWCLRCYHTRCRLRGDSMSACVWGMLDMMFMLLGILIVLAVEWYIAWKDERVPADARFGERARGAWLLFLESGVKDGVQCCHAKDTPAAPATRCRQRAISCPY